MTKQIGSMDKSRLFYGIDVGTTGCRVAGISKWGIAEVLWSIDGDWDMPSVVYFADESHVVVGRDAADMLEREPEHTVAFVKRALAESAMTDGAKAVYPYGHDGVAMMALLLKNVVDGMNALSAMEKPVRDGVLAVPLWYGMREKVEMKTACMIAGLTLGAFITEANAAVLSYRERMGKRWRGLVCDLGGGSFEATVVNPTCQKRWEVAYRGNARLGGVDWDMALAKYALEAYNKENGTAYALEDDARLKWKLLREAEMKKTQLTVMQSTQWKVAIGEKSVSLEITRKLFEELTADLMEKVMELIRQAVDDAGRRGFRDIKECLLVGGATKMPWVRERLEREFGWMVRLEEPGRCVAKGTAIYGRNLLRR